MIGWLTPDAGDGSTVPRVLIIPAELLYSVNGALQELAEPFNWEQYGDMTPDEAAALAESMLQEYYVSAYDSIAASPLVVPLFAPSGYSSNWQSAINANLMGNGYWARSSEVINGYVYWNMYLVPGTWRLTVMYHRVTSGGITRLYVDGASIGTVDMYGSSAPNSVFTYQPFTITAPGLHEVRFVTDAKFSSSSGYAFRPQMMSLARD